MHPYTVLGIIFVLLHLIAVPAFVWAVRKRQIRRGDADAYRVVSGGAPQAASGTAEIPRVKRIAFFSVLIFFFAWMFVSTLRVIYVAQHTQFKTQEDEPSFH